MEEDTLSPEQIDALTQAVSDKDKAGTGGETKVAAGGLSDEQAQAVKDTLNHAMADAATLLTSTLGAQVEITVNEVAPASEDSISNLLPAPYTIASFSFNKGFTGDLALVFSEGDANALAEALAKGGEEASAESEASEEGEAAEEGETPKESEASAEANPETAADIGGLFDQMMGAAAESLGSVFNEEIAFDPVNVASDDGSGLGVLTQGTVQANMSFKVEGLMDSNAVCLLQAVTVGQMAGESQETAAEEEVETLGDEDIDLSAAMPDIGDQEGVIGQPAEFSALAPGEKGGEPQNIDLLLDVSLPIVIELGRTSMKIQDILDLGPGSVVELDKLAGEPVDIIVNDKQIAKGEVVVVEENFGVRITNLVSPLERIKNLR